MGGGVLVNRVAKWDGVRWSALAGGVSHPVRALTVWDDGSGAALYVGGDFTSASGAPANHVAKWDGTSWTALGGGVSAPVDALAVFDDGSGAVLHVGGEFTSAGGAPAQHVARWDGSAWSPHAVGMAATRVLALAAFDPGTGPSLYAGGRLDFARWDGMRWSAVGSGLDRGIHALATFDDGSGAGAQLHAASLDVRRWDGSRWTSLGGVAGQATTLASFDDGTGPALYAGGFFTGVGGVPANNVARWDGSRWSALGAGTVAPVTALVAHDDGLGNGPALYASWYFASSSLPGRGVARWNGASWTPLPAGVHAVRALAVFDDGVGSALYAAGDFTTTDGAVANRVARWNGASWSSLSSGTNAPVHALCVFDDGRGAALYAGGRFTSAGGVAASYVARWDGTHWSAVGSGAAGAVTVLGAFDDGQGPALYAGGAFLAGGRGVNIARWDGASWSALGSGVSGTVSALAPLSDRSGPALFVGGFFANVPDSGDSYVGRWSGCDARPPELACPDSVAVLDRLGSPPGEMVSFEVDASDDHDPAPSVVCEPPSGSFFARGATLVTCTATDGSGNATTRRFWVRVEQDPRRR